MLTPLDVTLLAPAGWCAATLLAGLQLRAHRRLVRVARASHELRGPLCAARLGLESLRRESARAATIDLELARAGRALDDLAAAPSGARTRERHESLDLALLAADHAPSWQALATAHGTRVRFEPPEEDSPPLVVAGRRSAVLAAVAEHPVAGAPATLVVGDALRLAQACTNLVANAIEHGRGDVRVRVRRVDRVVRFEVGDDGPGLSAPRLALLAAARARRGRRGHGLAIAAAIAERHGGRLGAEGARVALVLPAAGAPRAPRRRRARRRA